MNIQKTLKVVEAVDIEKLNIDELKNHSKRCLVLAQKALKLNFRNYVKK